MLTVQDVHSYYGSSHILQGVTLHVGAGEVLGLFGRNGAGKSTLLKTAAGWVRPSAGSIVAGNRELAGLPPERVCAAGMAFVPEDRRIFPGLSVEENLGLALLQDRKLSAPQRRDAIARIYDRFPRLGERRKQTGTSLSGGEQQMLAMARAIVCRPSVLLVDEPTEGLAPMVVRDIFGLIRELRDQGTAILLVEQNLKGALDVCDRFVVMERGRLVEQGTKGVREDEDRLFAAIAV